MHRNEDPSNAYKLVLFSQTHRHPHHKPLTCTEAHEVIVQHILNEDLCIPQTTIIPDDDSKIDSDGPQHVVSGNGNQNCQ